MLYPIALRVQCRLDPGHAAPTHGVETVGDPVHVLFDRHDHLGFHRRAAGAGEGEHIREAGDHQTEVGARTARPFLRQGGAVADADVDFLQGSGHGIEAGGKHDGIKCVLSFIGAQTCFRQRLDRRGAGIDEGHIVTVVGLVIVGIQAQALGADRMILRCQQFRDSLVFDDAADFVAYEFRCGVVGCLVHQDIVVGIKKTDAATLGPFGFVLDHAFLRGGLQRGLGRRRKAGDTERSVVCSQAPFGVFRLVARLDFLVRRAVAGGQAEICGTLEDVQMLRLPGNDRDHLHAGRSSADHTDA